MAVFWAKMPATIAFALAVAVQGPPSELPAYMDALEEFVARQRQVAEHVVAGRMSEARELLDRPVPAALAQEAGGLKAEISYETASSGKASHERAAFLDWIGFPELAAAVIDEMARRGLKSEPWLTSSVFRNLVVSGQVDAARQWAQARLSDRERRWTEEALRDPETYDGGATTVARLRGALRMWRTRPSEPDAAFYDRLVRRLIGRGRRLALEAAAARPGASVDETAARLRQAARESHGGDSLEAWRRLAVARLTHWATAEALYQWGTLEVARGRAADAVPLLEEARDLDPDVRGSDAQWVLGFAYLALGNTDAALSAWRRDEEEFLSAPCLRADAWLKHRIWQGLALERLGRRDEALAHYAAALRDPMVAAHVLDLYEAAGQFDDVERLFGQMELRSPAEYGDAVPGKSMLVLRRMARAKDWASLVGAATAVGDFFDRPDEVFQPHQEVPRVVAREAIRLLARDCRASVPAIVESANSVKTFQPAHVRALGSCGTPEAVRVLLVLAADQSPHVFQTARAALALTAPGRHALASRGWPAPAAGSREYDTWREPKPEFPVPDRRRLPSKVTPEPARPPRIDQRRTERLTARRLSLCEVVGR